MFGFDEAIKLLKQGKKLQRKGWNGKDIFIYLTTGSVVRCEKLKPETHNHLENFLETSKVNEVEILPHIDMKASDGTIVIGWLASQTDMLAEDWEVIK
jgi:hypothetical protein